MAEVAHVTNDLERTEPPQEVALRRLIDAERQALDRSLDRLEDRVKEKLDWRRHVSRHRGALIAAASGAALIGAWRWRRRRSPADRAVARLVDGAREATTEACEAIANLGSYVSVRRRVPRVVLAPLMAAAAHAALRWWDDGGQAGAAGRPPADGRTDVEEETWTLEKRMP